MQWTYMHKSNIINWKREPGDDHFSSVIIHGVIQVDLQNWRFTCGLLHEDFSGSTKKVYL